VIPSINSRIRQLAFGRSNRSSSDPSFGDRGDIPLLFLDDPLLLKQADCGFDTMPMMDN
jgi:hypothetical protein